MKAARLHAYGQPLVIEDVPVPQPSPGEVVVKIGGAGFCHSDLHVIDGEIRILPGLPITLGHENAGHVAALDTGVRTVREGDPIAVFGGWGCGACSACVTGEEQLCDTPQWAGLSQDDGGYAEFLLVPHERHLGRLQHVSPRDAAPSGARSRNCARWWRSPRAAACRPYLFSSHRSTRSTRCIAL